MAGPLTAAHLDATLRTVYADLMRKLCIEVTVADLNQISAMMWPTYESAAEQMNADLIGIRSKTGIHSE